MKIQKTLLEENKGDDELKGGGKSVCAVKCQTVNSGLQVAEFVELWSVSSDLY